MRGSFRLHLILLLVTALSGPTLADTDPSLSQVYEAVRIGHLEQAQKMIREVLHDHPKSAKAHYAAAEVNAASGNVVLGRQELGLAQELAPGLPFAAPESVLKLRSELSRTPLVKMPLARETGAASTWSVLAVMVIGIAVILAVWRRAPTDGYADPREAGSPPAAESPTTAAAAGVPSTGAGIGPSIAGDLAAGVAAGAGIAAGEEIARHLLNFGDREADSRAASESTQQHESDHTGGHDFGISGANSWKDDDQASGGDDWT